MPKKYLPIIILIPVLLLTVAAYNLPPVHERLSWRVDEVVMKIRTILNPPEQVVFVPQEPASGPGEAGATPVLPTPSATFTPEPSPTPTQPGPTSTPAPTLSPTPEPTPLPSRVILKGVRYEDQHNRWNYCAPANLAMALSFWGWKGDRDDTGPVLKPNNKDKNVMPYEIVTYVQEQTDLRVVQRVAGDNNLLKRFIAAGFPVLIEKGTYLRDMTGAITWMGHYTVVNGYDDGKSAFITQDSYISPDYIVSYADMTTAWRSFNYVYLIIYPAEREAEVMALLGPDADETYNLQQAAQRASDEIFATTGIDHYFAWFNRGTSLMQLQDYSGAAQAYDEAFQFYPSISEKERPWRMMWYQTGPYFAYYFTGRYYDVITLAEKTLDAMVSEKNLEESYYWRGLARGALGDSSGAITDLRTSLEYHPGFEPAIYQLKLLGVDNP